MKSLTALVLASLFFLPGLASAGFTDNGNGSVTDRTTNLMWQKCSQGQTYNSTDNHCSDNNPAATTATWEPAIAYCESLNLGGFTDWRLPNIKELLSLVDDTKATAPLIDGTYFPSTESSYFWSSTTFAPDTSYAWTVAFFNGYTYYNGKASAGYVRCVRGE